MRTERTMKLLKLSPLVLLSALACGEDEPQPIPDAGPGDGGFLVDSGFPDPPAEIVSFTDLDAAGSMAAARAAGRVRMEGKDYVMQDGDVVEFRFNV